MRQVPFFGMVDTANKTKIQIKQFWLYTFILFGRGNKYEGPDC